MATGNESTDHLAMQVGPRRVAVEQEHWVDITRAFVNEMKPERGAISSGDRSVVRREVVVLEIDKSFVGGA
jgi:hypothetical protein